MAVALRFLAALLPLKSRNDVSPINDPSLGVACLLRISAYNTVLFARDQCKTPCARRAGRLLWNLIVDNEGILL